MNARAAEAIAPQVIASAIDYVRFETIAEPAEMAASYWHSVALAAMRGERLTVETHCRQVSLVTKEAFAVVKTLGSGPDETASAA
jgi:hypothetical protein